MGTPPPTPAHPTPQPPHLHLHTSTSTPPPAPAHLHLPNLQATPETCTCTHLASPAMDIRDKNEFIYFMQRACENQSNDCYIELYNILLRAFVTADVDFDGKVSEQEFGGMIAAAAALPKKFGFDWWQGSIADQFKAIDDNGDGEVSFDEWLGFAYKNYQTQALPAAFDKSEKDVFVAECKEVGNTGSEAYKKIYFFSWKCFQAADADRDGQVDESEFAKRMDENGDASIAYDEWLAFFLKEIISPVAA